MEKEQFEVDGIMYTIDDTNAKVLKNEYKGDIVIPSEIIYGGKTYRVTSIGDEAFSDCSGLNSVTIPDSMTIIGSWAFFGCTNLTSVIISDLEAWCKITFVRHGSNPLHYAQHLFLNGTEITELEIPNSVTIIGNYSFTDCIGLKSVTIPNSVKRIGDNAFFGCNNLTAIHLSKGLKSIGDFAFMNAKNYLKFICQMESNVLATLHFGAAVAFHLFVFLIV